MGRTENKYQVVEVEPAGAEFGEGGMLTPVQAVAGTPAGKKWIAAHAQEGIVYRVIAFTTGALTPEIEHLRKVTLVPAPAEAAAVSKGKGAAK